MAGKKKKLLGGIANESLEEAMRSRMQAEEDKAKNMEIRQENRRLGQEVVGDNVKNQYR